MFTGAEGVSDCLSQLNKCTIIRSIIATSNLLHAFMQVMQGMGVFFSPLNSKSELTVVILYHRTAVVQTQDLLVQQCYLTPTSSWFWFQSGAFLFGACMFSPLPEPCNTASSHSPKMCLFGQLIILICSRWIRLYMFVAGCGLWARGEAAGSGYGVRGGWLSQHHLIVSSPLQQPPGPE